jgi:predicted lipoprotein with Yx(FWY)xxD motif
VRTYKKSVIPTAVVATALLVAACGSASNSSSTATPQSAPASSGPGLVKTAANSAVGGTVLVNAKGLTLYRLSGEKAGKFICTTTACLQTWHPLLTTSAKADGSVTSLTVIKRPNGSMQLAYKGQPLYTFAGDTSPGQDKGQGFKDVGTWNAVTTGSTSSPAQSSSSSSSSGGGGSVY